MKLKQILLSAAVSVAFCGTAIAADFKVGTECTFPPYNYRDAAGNLAGFDIDVGNEIAKRVGFDIEWVCQAWDGIIPGLLAGKYDLIIASMTDTDARREKIDFTEAYDFSVARFVTAEGGDYAPFKDGVPDVEGLKGAAVGVQRATTYDAYISDMFADVEIKRYDQADNVFLDLKSGRLDLAMLGQSSAHASFLSKPEGEGFAFVGPPIISPEHFGRGNAVALRKGQDELRESISKAIRAMHADGTINGYHLTHVGIPQK